jgi:hypothetical protein
MTRVARSVSAFGIYLSILGGVLIATPNTLLSAVHLPPTNEPWIHILGVAVLGMGILFLAGARAEQTAFLRATIGARLFAFASFVALVLLHVAPPLVAGFGVADLAGALWTFAAFRQSAVSAPAV